MSDTKRDIPLPPITRPAGTFTPGTLLDTPVKRTGKKSPFLRKLERAQKRTVKPAALGNVTPLSKGVRRGT